MMRRVVRSLLWICCLFLTYQLVIALRVAVRAPQPERDAVALSFAAAVRAEKAKAEQRQHLDETRYASIWERRLEPQAQETVSSSSEEEPLTLTLEGVVLEPGNDFAFVRTSDGMLRAVRVGERVENGTVTRIEKTRVVMSIGGQEVELPVEKAENR